MQSEWVIPYMHHDLAQARGTRSGLLSLLIYFYGIPPYNGQLSSIYKKGLSHIPHRLRTDSITTAAIRILSNNTLRSDSPNKVMSSLFANFLKKHLFWTGILTLPPFFPTIVTDISGQAVAELLYGRQCGSVWRVLLELGYNARSLVNAILIPSSWFRLNKYITFLPIFKN